MENLKCQKTEQSGTQHVVIVFKFLAQKRLLDANKRLITDPVIHWREPDLIRVELFDCRISTTHFFSNSGGNENETLRFIELSSY